MGVLEFRNKCQEMLVVFQSMQIPVHVQHDRDFTWVKFIRLDTREEMSVCNFKGQDVFYCHHLDLSVKINESNDYLEVV